MIITIGNTKGGVGKTTLAVNLAIARALKGREVWLIDGDRQGTAETAISIRAEAGSKPGIACATYPDGPTLRGQVQQQAAKARGVKFGPRPALTAAQLDHARQLIDGDGRPVKEVAALLGVHRSTLYRALDDVTAKD